MARRELMVKVFNDVDEAVVNRWLAEHTDIEVQNVSLAGVGAGDDNVGWRYVILYKPLRAHERAVETKASTVPR